jgi:hypothetical protein
MWAKAADLAPDHGHRDPGDDPAGARGGAGMQRLFVKGLVESEK